LTCAYWKEEKNKRENKLVETLLLLGSLVQQRKGEPTRINSKIQIHILERDMQVQVVQSGKKRNQI